MMKRYIYESTHWPSFIWDNNLIMERQAAINMQAGHLFGRLHDIGLDAQLQTMTQMVTDNVVDSYSIEGIALDAAQVQSSVARRLGVEQMVQTEPSHYIDGIVEMMLDATTNYRTPLTEDRLNYINFRYLYALNIFPDSSQSIIFNLTISNSIDHPCPDETTTFPSSLDVVYQYPIILTS